MEREEEVEVVRKALEYERECLKKDQMLNNVRSERFSSMPSAPQMRVVTKPSYPMVEAPMKYNWKIWYLMIALIMYLLYKRIIPATEYTITLVIGIWAILPFVFKKIKNSKIEAIKKSPEYIQQCRMIDWQFQNDVMIAKQEYDYNMQYYNNTVLVDYNNQKKQWQSEHDQRLSIANKERNEAYSIMRDFYEKTRIIPEKYHNIKALQYLFSYLSSSQYSLKEAIDNYEINEQKLLRQALIREQREANDIAYQQAQLTAQQNDLLDEQNYIAERTRRDQNLANAVSAVQRHNTNKALNRIADNYNKK